MSSIRAIVSMFLLAATTYPGAGLAEQTGSSFSCDVAPIATASNHASLVPHSASASDLFNLTDGPFAGMYVIAGSTVDTTTAGNSYVTLGDSQGRRVSIMFSFPKVALPLDAKIDTVVLGKWRIAKADPGAPISVFAGRITGFVPANSAPKCFKIEAIAY